MMQAIVRQRGNPVVVTPSSATGEKTAVSNPDTVTSGLVTASGGNGTYSWARISGSASVNVNFGATGSNKTFSATVSPGVYSAVFRCTSGSESVDVPVTLTLNP